MKKAASDVHACQSMPACLSVLKTPLAFVMTDQGLLIVPNHELCQM